MRFVTHFLLISALLAPGAAAGGEPSDEERARQVAELVRQLDAPQFNERDAAQRQLEELGPAILPLLPEDGPQMSAEKSGRLTRLRQKLLREQAAAAAEPTFVTLAAQDISLSEVLAELAQQTGNVITDHRAAFGQVADERRVTVDFDKTPFWQALDQVLDQADLTLYGFAGEDGLFIVNRQPGAAPRTQRACYSGAFRIAPLRFEAQRDLGGAGQGALRLILEVSWEPRLRPFAILQPLSRISARTDDGAEVLPANPEAEPETLIRRGFSTSELDVTLLLPPRTSQTLRKFSGKLAVIVPGPHAEFRFQPLPLAGPREKPMRITQRQGGTTVTLDSVRENNDLWEANLRIAFEAPSTALESHRGWMLDNTAAFEDKSGERNTFLGIEQTRQTPEEIGLKYLFDLPEGPQNTTFVYGTPLIVLEVPVDYEFHDLPLP